MYDADVTLVERVTGKTLARRIAAAVTIQEEWMYQNRYELQHRYGAGTFVAVFDWAVIDWGTDPDAVRQRAETTISDRVFVGSFTIAAISLWTISLKWLIHPFAVGLITTAPTIDRPCIGSWSTSTDI
jgi:hypothetical protein